MNTTQYIDRLRELTPTRSNYAVAQLLETTDGAVAHWVHGRRFPDLATCVRIAELLGYDPLQVIADVEAEREIDEVKKTRWRELARKFGARAACFLVACTACLSPSDGRSASSLPNSCYADTAQSRQSTNYATRLRRLRRFLQRLCLRGSGRFPAFGS